MERIQPGFLGPVAQVIPRVRHFVASSSAMLLIPKKAVWPRGAEGPRSQWEKNTPPRVTGHPKLMVKNLGKNPPQNVKKNGV